ncbi:MAG: hypothetical protein K0R09_3603 [Clostridiales bacterium]|jgi:YbbR domain-containing protein|nr:hypothetical protein [Clostridiales bacterium]
MAHKSKQEITAIIASVLLAFVMWIYAMTDKNPMESKTVENIPVQLINTEAVEQSNLALKPGQTFLVSLDIKVKALDLYAAIDPANYNIVADLSSASIFQKGENNIMVEIKGKPPGIMIENPLGVPYTIKVNLEALATKSVGVKIEKIGSVKAGYGYLDSIVSPSEVIVRGPESMVNSVASLVGSININDKTNDANGNIAITPVDIDGNEVKYVTLEKPVVEVTVPVKPSKEVGVVVKTTGDIGENKILKKINQSATKVVIVGDKKDLDKVKEIETIPYDISKITSTHTDTLSLNLPEGIQVFQGISTLTVEFVVENIIESTVRIPINVINPREGYSYSNSVPDVSLTLRGAESVINSFDTSSISAIVDVNNLDVGQHNIDFKINLPSGVSVVKKVPDKISVTITKPEQEVTSP